MTRTTDWEQPEAVWPRATGFVLVLLFIGLFGWASWAKMQVSVSAIGSYRAKGNSVQVSTPLAGVATLVLGQKWQRVKKGQLLLELDAQGPIADEIKFQRENIEGQIRENDANLAIAVQEQFQTERILKQVSSLYQLGGVSQNELVAAQGAVRKALLGRQAIFVRSATLRAQIRSLSARKRVQIISPLDGTIMEVAIQKAGQLLQSGQSTFEIMPGDSPLVFLGAIPESERPKIQLGSKVEIAWNGYPRQKYGVTHAKLKAIAPSSQQTQSGALVYEVQIELLSKVLRGKPVLPGLGGEAKILSSKKSVLQIIWSWVRGKNPWEL